MSRPADSSPPRRGRPPRPPLPTGAKLLLAVLLLVPIVVPLVVPLYARETPELAGIPFFFWFQFALIPVASLLVVAAYLVTTRYENEHRSQR